jgi:hypothetical protein
MDGGTQGERSRDERERREGRSKSACHTLSRCLFSSFCDEDAKEHLRNTSASFAARARVCVCVCVCPKMSFADSYRSVVNFHINLNRGDED